MPNFFDDNEDLQFHFQHLPFGEIVPLRERDFAERELYPYAPENVADAVDSYARVLSMLGQLAAEFIAPRAPAVDEQGPLLQDGGVIYAPDTQEALKMLSQAGVMGFTLPRKYGGLNFPTVVYSMAIELVSRADASLMTLFGLQDIAETINEFASEELKEKYLPRFSAGEVTGAMVLTEPDAGSDLQAVRTTATEDPAHGCWRLNGVKRFITNGGADVLLVLARSEPGTTDARGLSLFLCEAQEGVRVRRLENKLGLHGSPTCELQFENAPAQLIGQRRRGLTRYVFSLLNGARVAIAAQALGIAEAAYEEALRFAEKREQFGKAIRNIPPVAEMLVNMRLEIEAGRSLLYETAWAVDMARELAHKMKDLPAEAREEKRRLRPQVTRFQRLASVLTPLAKYYLTEMCVRVANDALQVHGGSGYMKDYPVERLYRDARITTIYEGTSQLQIVAIIAGLLGGALRERLQEFATASYPAELEEWAKTLHRAQEQLLAAVEYVREKHEPDYTDLHARGLADAACDVYLGYLLLREAQRSERKALLARKFISTRGPQIEINTRRACSDDRLVLDYLDLLLGHSLAE